MLGELSNADARTTRSILRPLTRRRAVPGLQRRLRAPAEVPAAGLIVLRSAPQTLR